VLGLALLVTTMAPSAEAPAVIDPSSNWHVLEDKETCNATRLYGEGQDSAMVLEASPPYPWIGLTVTFPQQQPLSGAMTATLAFDGGAALPLKPMSRPLSDKRSILQGFLLGTEQIDGLTKAKIARFELRNQRASIALADMPTVLTELNRCRGALLVSWGGSRRGKACRYARRTDHSLARMEPRHGQG
jgi:hypothetical protein